MEPVKTSTVCNNQSPFVFALKVTFPIFIAYIPLGIVFGLLFCHLGFAWYLAPLMSLFVFGGSVQFAAISILAMHGSYTYLLITTFFLALRNVFYGISFLQRFNQKWYIKGYLVFGLVDSTYALLVSNRMANKKDDNAFCLWSAFLIHFYWVLGTIIGSWGSHWIPSIPGLGFVLPCLFMILVIDQYLKVKSIKPFLLTAVIAAIAIYISKANMLLIAIFACAFIIITFYPNPKEQS